jgi:uncharacterized membrane protein YGL010W
VARRPSGADTAGMKSLTEQLAKYAAYHRDRRNILTHFVGIPMIMLAVSILLARLSVGGPGSWWSAATAVSVALGVYYLRLDLRLGLTMGMILAMSLALGTRIAAGPDGLWLATGAGLFVIGWILQFIGHLFEGRKPAFVDDLMGLAIGPLFVVVEAGFLMGQRPELQAAIEAHCGPVRDGGGQAA